MTNEQAASAAPTYDEALLRARSALNDAHKVAERNPEGAKALVRVADSWVGMACAIAHNADTGVSR